MVSSFIAGDRRYGDGLTMRFPTKYLGRRHGEHIHGPTIEYYVDQGDVLKGFASLICGEGFVDLQLITA
jgi:hypothetical protein